MSKQRKGTGYVRGGFSPEPAGILPYHLRCLLSGRDSYYSLFTKAILALGTKIQSGMSGCAEEMRKCKGLIRSCGATDPQAGFVFIWDIPLVTVHAETTLLSLNILSI